MHAIQEELLHEGLQNSHAKCNIRYEALLMANKASGHNAKHTFLL